MIRQLLYRSAQLYEFSAQDMGRLLRDARAHNARHGIGGLLLLHDGLFMQLLEGPAAAVDALYARIVRDPRHCEVRLLVRREQPTPLLCDAHMAWAEAPADDDDLPAFAGLDHDVRALAALERAGQDPVAATMRAFLRGHAVPSGGLVPAGALQ